MASLKEMKEKLASLNRQYREIILKSQDGETELPVYYRRPTEMEDEILRKAMENEFESIRDGLKNSAEGKESLFDQLVKSFSEGKPDAAINYIVLERIPGIREAAKIEANLKDLSDDASQEEKDEWLEKFKEPFDRRVQDAKDEWKDVPIEVLASRAAESRIEAIARERAYEIYRRCLVAQSIYLKDDETDKYERVYDSPEDVKADLDKTTIDTLATKIVEEINRYKNLPLK